MAEGFLDRLLGIHDIRFNGGSKLPRRNVLNFLNGRVLDSVGETQIIVADNPVWSPTDLLTAQADDYTTAGFEDLTDVALTGNQDVTGFVAAGVNVLKKRIWNLDETGNTRLLHENVASLATNRIITPGGSPLVITSNDGALIVRNFAGTRWIAIPCLV